MGSKIQSTREQVNDVVSIMQQNVQQVVQRGDDLNDLSNRADSLQMNAMEFQQQGTAIRKKMWWKNMKMYMAIGAVLIIILIIVIISLTTGGKDDSNSDGN